MTHHFSKSYRKFTVEDSRNALFMSKLQCSTRLSSMESVDIPLILN